MKLIILYSMLFCSFAFGRLAMATGKAFNPDISANFLGAFRSGSDISNDRTEVPHNGFTLQEAEVQFTADVDPYMKANVLLAVGQEDGSTAFGIDPEEVYLESIALPAVTVSAGKRKLALGKHNQLHAHAFPFIDAPMINEELLGEEGLNETGVSAAVLLPLHWYSEVIAQVFDASNEDLYNSPKSRQTGELVHAKNLFDLSDDLTMEIGASQTSAKNQTDHTSSVLGADLTFKWRPANGGKYHAVIWSTEYLTADRKGFVDADSNLSTEKLGGYATWVQYQWAERWWAQARHEQVGIPKDDGNFRHNKESLLVGFFPSEFSGIRIQYDYLNAENKAADDQRVTLQYNVSIGAHPAHAY